MTYDRDWNLLIERLIAAMGQGGDDARIASARSLLQRCADAYPERHLDMRLCSVGPTFRQAAEAALNTVPNRE